jgi:hypothetical protein
MTRQCLLLAQTGHPNGLNQCPLLGVKQTLTGRASMSAFDAVDGASSDVSKCYLVGLKARATKEVKPLPTWELEALKELARA